MPLLRLDLRQRRTWLAIAGGLFALVAALRVWLAWVGPLPGDRFAVYHFVYRGLSPAVEQVLTLYSVAGSSVAAIVTVLVAASVLHRTDGIRSVAGLLLATAIVIVNALIKHFAGPTPLWHDVRPHGSVNFPSGHAAYAVAVFGFISVAAWRHRQRELFTVACLLAAGMGPARVLAGSHLVSDAIAGMSLGGGWLILTLLWTRTVPPAGG